MFKLIGNVSKKVYYEAENASDLNKWRLDNFLKGSQADGHMVSQYDAPEAMATGNEMLVSDHVDEIEVIGNVHENPELLEEDE